MFHQMAFHCMSRIALGSALAVLLLVVGPVQAKMYKCTDAHGRVSYQQKPCASDAGTADEIKIRSTQSSRPVSTTKKNKRRFRYYTTHANQQVIVDACVRRGSPSAAEITQAHKRYFEIARENIEAGRKIAQSGFKGLPAAEIRDIARKAQRKKRRELNAMSANKLDRLCDAQAGKLRRLAAQVRNRSSGYAEGDLDPEGND